MTDKGVTRRTKSIRRRVVWTLRYLAHQFEIGRIGGLYWSGNKQFVEWTGGDPAAASQLSQMADELEAAS